MYTPWDLLNDVEDRGLATFYNGTYKFEFCNNSAMEYYRCLLEKEHIANIHNKKEMVGPDGETIEVFEFTGAMVDSKQEETITIDQLYERITNES